MNRRLVLCALALGCGDTTAPYVPALRLTIVAPAVGDRVHDLDSLLLLGEAQASDLGLLPDDSIWWTQDGLPVGTGRRVAIWPAAGHHVLALHARFGSRSNAESRVLEVGGGLGRVLWTVPLDTSAPAESFLAFDGDRRVLIAADSNTRVAVAINLDGSIRWRTNLGLSQQENPPAIGPDGALFYGMWVGPAAGPSTNLGGGVLALNPDGSHRWSFFAVDHGLPGSNWYHSHGGVAVDGAGRVYLATEEDDGPLYAISPAGALLWRTALGDPTNPEFRSWRFYSYPTIVADSLVVSLHRDDSASAVSAGGGGLRWRIPDFAGFNLLAAAVGADGSVYVAGRSGRLGARAPDGAPVWDIPLPVALQNGSPIVGPDRMYFAAANGGITVVSLTGQVVETWGPPPAGYFHDAITLGANGVVYTAVSDTLISYDRTGARRFAIPIPHDLSPSGQFAQGGPVIGPDGTLYLHASRLGVMAIRDTVGPATDAPWPTLQGNFRRTGRRATDQ